MQVILSPIPIEELLKLTPRNYPEVLDKYDNIDVEKYFYTPGGQKLHNLIPYHIGYFRHRIKNKRAILKDIFWDIIFVSCYYNKDYYIYVTTDKWFFKNIGSMEMVRVQELREIKPEDKLKKYWFNYEKYDYEELNNKIQKILTEFVENINLKEKPIWELKIEGVKE